MSSNQDLTENTASIYWELCRPFTLLAPSLGFIAFAIAGWSKLEDTSLISVLPQIIFGALSASILNAASNIINQYFDLAIDCINKPTRPLPSKRITIKNAMIFCFILYCISFTLAFLVSWQFFWIVMFTAIVTYAYSGPPLRTKRSWFWANLTIAIPRGCLLVVAGWTAVRSMWEVEPWLLGGIFGLYIFGAATTKDFADIEGDRAGGCITLPIKFGIDCSAKIISPFFVLPFILMFVGTFLGYLNGNPLILLGLSTILVFWGVYVAYLIVRRPSELATEDNHVSWKHMYLMMLVGQLGIAIAYVL